MRKNVFGRRLRRDRNERKALFKSLMSALVLVGYIKTTKEKASAIKGQVDKLVTIGKKENKMLANRLLSMYLTPKAMEKLLDVIVPQLDARNSGYTTQVGIGNRVADNAAMVQLSWVGLKQEVAVVHASAPKKGKAASKKEDEESTIIDAEIVTEKETPASNAAAAKKESKAKKVVKKKGEKKNAK